MNGIHTGKGVALVTGASGGIGALYAERLATIPALADAADGERFDAARKAMGPSLSRSSPAPRYSA